MAIIKFGTALKGFGTSADGTENVAGMVLQELGEPLSSDLVEVRDEHNHIISAIMAHGEYRDVTLTVVPKEGTAEPTAGEVIQYDSQTLGGSRLMAVQSVDPQESNGAELRWVIADRSWPNITLPAPT